MREILFRGKRKDNGEWVEGFYLFTSENTYPVIIDMKCCSHIIIPETVGQYTGLKDKNGTKIFEGDIVRRCDNVERVFYNGGGFSPFAIPGWECTPDADECEIIGNIHDNPELLGEK